MRLSLVYIEKKVTNKMELDAPFGLIYFRGLPDANLHLTYQLFSPDSKFVFSSIISKNRFDFCQTIFVLTVQKKDRTLEDRSLFHYKTNLGVIQFQSE